MVATMASAPAAAADFAGLVGTWSGEATCGYGKNRFVMTINEAADDKGNNAVVMIYEGSGRSSMRDSEVHGAFVGVGKNNVEFVPDKHAPLVSRRLDAPKLKGRFFKDGTMALRPLGDVDCQDVKFARTTEATEPAVIPAELQALVGAWDGAIIEKDGEVTALTFEISPTSTGFTGDVLQAVIIADGEERGTFVLSAPREGETTLTISKLTGSAENGLRFDGTLKGKLETDASREYFTFYGGRFLPGTGYAVRRPADRGDRPLAELCKEVLEPMLDGQQEGRRIGRQLKTTFFPALGDYDPAAAAMNPRLPVDASFDLGALIFDCVATNKHVRGISRLGLVASILDTRKVIEAHFTIPRSSTGFRDVVNVSLKQEMRTADYADAEAAFAAGLGDPAAMTTFSALIGHIEQLSRVDGFMSIPPSVLSAHLAPFASRIAELEQEAAIAVSAERQAQARARLAGIASPSELPPAWSEAFEEIAEGAKTYFDANDMAFFGGFVATAIDKCGQPVPVDQRLRLVRLFVQGIDQSLFGDSYATGTITDMLLSTASNTVTYSEGAALPTAIGCQSPYLAGILANLADASDRRSVADSGRASLFVRSCANDRSPSQCRCMVEEMRSVIPDIDLREYDREQLVFLINGNPAVALRMAGMCQVGDY
jgi:hypothetical protein